MLFLNTLDVQLANEVVLEQNLFFHLRYNYRQNKWLTYEAFSQYQRNVPLRINERILAGVGPRIRILEEEKSSIFIGLIGMYEHDDELNNEIIHRDVRLSNYLTLNLAWKDRLEWSNYLYYQPRVDNWEDFRTSVQTLLKLKLLKNLAFATTLSLAYDAFPVVDPAIPQLTVKWLNGITYQF
ncbi:MAG: DUF481 domain-containing protein [Owenweeksia sp.]|nr:DUF481 domain-containing protein [Owenweeksia sp.]